MNSILAPTLRKCSSLQIFSPHLLQARLAALKPKVLEGSLETRSATDSKAASSSTQEQQAVHLDTVDREL